MVLTMLTMTMLMQVQGAAPSREPHCSSCGGSDGGGVSETGGKGAHTREHRVGVSQ